MKINIDQRSPEWLELRRTKIGASDIPVIMGTSPWGSIPSLIKEKRGEGKTFFNEHMQRGVLKESDILDAVEKEIGVQLERSPVYVKEDSPFVMASLDGLTADGSMIVEAKAPSMRKHTEYKETGIPIYYYQQMQWQMYASGIQKAVFSSWCDGDLYLEDVDYDPKVIEEILPKAEDFYSRYIVGTEEAKDTKTHEFIEDPKWEALQIEYMDLMDLKKPLSDKLKELEEKESCLKKAMSEVSQGRSISGNYIKLTVCERAGSIDEDKLKKAGINVDEFRKKPTSYLRISQI